MAVKKENVRVWITIPQNTKKTITLLMPLLKAKSMGEVVDRAVISYALAVGQLCANKIAEEQRAKKGNQDNEKVN